MEQGLSKGGIYFCYKEQKNNRKLQNKERVRQDSQIYSQSQNI